MCEEEAALRVAVCCKGESAACVLGTNSCTGDGCCGLVHGYATKDAFHGGLRGCMGEGECEYEQRKQRTHATPRGGDSFGNS